MVSSLLEKITDRRAGICLYGLVPPRQATPPNELREIVVHQTERIARLELDGVIVYDIEDEADRTATPRPFPFLPVMDPNEYANDHLSDLGLPRIVYRRVGRDTPETFVEWLSGNHATTSVLVGAPTRTAQLTLPLADAYALARSHAPELVLGGIAIAERHGRRFDEHERIIAKTKMGCRFFVTQSVYDVTSTKSLLSDYALAAGDAAVPIILTFSPCGSEKTLEFMKWLGISFPRWLENELRFAPDPLATSMKLCEDVFTELWDYARDKKIPVGINVESVSIRKREIEASIALASTLRARMA